jgi:O-antigen/teichoic acid export membrane protein
MKGGSLEKNEIRLQYSGFVIFAARMLSVGTGMIFTLLITRNVKTEQFGIWGNMFDLTAWFIILASAIPFWTTRFVARGKEGAAKTGFFANLAIAIISAVLYITLIPLLSSVLNVGEYAFLYFIAALYIIDQYLLGVLEATLRAQRPQAIGYGLLVNEFCKIFLAYVLIVGFQQALLGAIISLVTGLLVQIMYYLRLVSHDFGQKIQWNYIREWVKGSLANIYQLVGNQIASFALIMLFVYGGQFARGNYLAATTIANIVTYSSFLSFALYPKLLAEKNLEDITTSMKMVLMFAIPMTAGAIAIADSFLTILGDYSQVAPILMLLAIDALVSTIGNFYTFVLFGVEKLDEEARIPLKQLVKSRMFKVFTLPYIHALIALPATFYVLLNFGVNQPVQAPLYVTIINMTVRFAMFLVLYGIVRKTLVIAVPWRSIAKYVFAAAVMAALLYVIPHPTRIITTLGMTAVGGVTYLALLMAMDKEARELIKAILQEIREKVGILGNIVP